MAFCKHRWSNIKTWVTKEMLHVIQRCRWCNKWQRLEMPKDDIEGLTVSYKLDESTPSNPKVTSASDPGGTSQSDVDIGNSQAQIVESEHLESKSVDNEAI